MKFNKRGFLFIQETTKLINIKKIKENPLDKHMFLVAPLALLHFFTKSQKTAQGVV